MVLCSVGRLLIFFIATSLASDLHAINILLVPSNIISHVRLFTQLAVDLARLGDHKTTVLAPSTVKVPDFATSDIENFSYLQYPVDGDVPFVNSPEVSKMMISMAMTKSPLERMRLVAKQNSDMRDNCEQDCILLLDNIKLMRHIRDAGFQFAIMDSLTAVACYYIIPYSLGIPYASLSVAINSLDIYRLPRLYVYPNIFSVSDRPTFFQRLAAFLVDMMDIGIFSDSTHYMKKYAPHRPFLSAIELVQHQSLWFLIEDISVGHPLPQMPNTVAVGDIMASGDKKRPLKGKIQQFVSNSSGGVVVVSFGSFCDYFPPEILNALCEAFTVATKRLKVSFVWKLKAERFCQNENILSLPWIPQNDLLANSKVRLFINHGGFNSIIESVNYAKPLIIFPIGLDQHSNAAAAESKGFAIQMDIADFSSESLLSNIDKLLTEPVFRRNAQLSSAIMRDRHDTPAQRVSAMIDHVIKYGDQHLRTGALELSKMQFMMFDIFAALFAAAALVVAVLLLSCCCIYRKCCRRFDRGNRTKHKSQ